MLDMGATLWYYMLVPKVTPRLSVRSTVPGRQTYPADMESLRSRAH